MCNVCVAQCALKKGGWVTKWELPNGSKIHIEANGDGPEGEPCTYRIRCITDNGGRPRKGSKPKWSRWSKWGKTNDLAGVTSMLGMDVKWEFVGPLARQLLAGNATPSGVVDYIRVWEDMFIREIAADTTIYTSFLEHGHVLFTTNELWPKVDPRWKAKRSAVIPPSGGAVILDDTVRWLVGLEEYRPLAYLDPDEEGL